jgi:hypothetical protein
MGLAIRTGHLYTGISWLVMDLSLLQTTCVLAFNSSDSPVLLLQFDLETGQSSRPPPFSTRNEQETTHPRNTRIKKIGILIPPSFLRHHIQKEILSDLLQQASQYNPTPTPNPSPSNTAATRRDLPGQSDLSPHHLLLHNRLLLLAEKFLYSFINKITPTGAGSINWAKAKEKDIEALKDVMRMLCDTHLNKFPSIEALSKTAMMSSTKLKDPLQADLWNETLRILQPPPPAGRPKKC